MKKYTSILLTLMLGAGLFIMMTGCDTILPDNYEEGDFKIAAQEEHACEMLTAELALGNTQVNNFLYTESYKWNHFIDTTVTPLTGGYKQIVSILMDSLKAVNKPLQADTLLNVLFPKQGGDTTYALYHAGSSGAVDFYVSWVLTDENINSYINIDLMKADGTVLDKPLDMSLETVAGCVDHYFVVDTGEEMLVPGIRHHYQYQVEPGDYLVRIINLTPGAMTYLTPELDFSSSPAEDFNLTEIGQDLGRPFAGGDMRASGLFKLVIL